MNWSKVKLFHRGEIINGNYMGEYCIVIRNSTLKNRYHFISINFAFKLIPSNSIIIKQSVHNKGGAISLESSLVMQSYLKDIPGSFPDYLNKVNIAI